MHRITTLAVIAGLLVSAVTPTFAASHDMAGLYTSDQQATIDKRRKPRVPGGSGCDDPRDLIEHPECQG
ncbi:hypothetical protein QKW60_16605 [Defluviimonas aestuarii]|uniref:hypothetical protein n=1 Tax=Albidovulum aestuarii TaxID=1130726 RepID=UPI00249CCE56|nr:hypothetical protein [Defluviimonas aestuarii]MDI3338031.1 hypothetical protein [Defluviimonas aestuarii]